MTRLKSRCKVLLVRLFILSLVFVGAWVLEEITGRSKVAGKGGELVLTCIVDRYLFGKD